MTRWLASLILMSIYKAKHSGRIVCVHSVVLSVEKVTKARQINTLQRLFYVLKIYMKLSNVYIQFNVLIYNVHWIIEIGSLTLVSYKSITY